MLGVGGCARVLQVGMLGCCCYILAMSPVMTIQAELESGICGSYTKQDQQDTFMQLTSGWSCQPRTLMVPPLPRLFSEKAADLLLTSHLICK